MGRPFVLLPFEPLFVPRNPRADVEQCSVLRPIAGRRHQRMGDDDFCVEVFRRTLTLWRDRVRDWFLLGWSPQGGRIGKLLNCPPCGVATAETLGGRTWCCNQQTVCPWCWGRVSSELYARLLSYVVPPGGYAEVPHDVYAARGKTWLEMTPQTLGCVESVAHELSEKLRLTLRANDGVYSYRNVSVAAVARRSRRRDVPATWYWVFYTSYVLVQPPGYRSPKGAERLATLHGELGMAKPHYWPSASANQVKHAAILVRRYPDALLTCPDVGLAYKAMASRWNRPLSRSGGSG